MRSRLAVLAVAVFTAASAAQAQSAYIWAGGGMSMPDGDPPSGRESGMIGTLGLGIPIKSVKGLSVQGELQMGSWDQKVGTGSVSQNSFFANLGYDINPNDMKLYPWIVTGIGSMSSKVKGEKSDSEMAFQLAAGLTYMASPKWAIWAGPGYIMSGSGTKKRSHMPLMAGVSLSLGGSQ
ncbi:MAG: porin family protein [Gemmatimonadetes bacterium]|nr:porin family protein [Gemmatimonadota bacterium]